MEQRSEPSDGAPAVLRGAICAYRFFDAGDTIALDAAEKAIAGAKQVELGGPLVEGLVIPARPLELSLGLCEVEVVGIPGVLRARVTAHIFDFGAVAVLYEIPIEPGTTLVELTKTCAALYDAAELDRRGARHRQDILELLGSAVEKPHAWDESESYTIVFLEELTGASLSELAHSEVAAKLLLGETSPKALSAAVREDVLRNSFSYLEDDLVILDWNSAIVVEPGGSRIIPNILEFATSQLLEFRYYDGLLDRELSGVYKHVEHARRRVFRNPYATLARAILRRFMELTEFTERVDNAIKSVGDFYLARVYLAALRRFRVPEWRESVEAKLGLVARAYELLKSEVETSRSQLLEIIVILLILIELLSTLKH